MDLEQFLEEERSVIESIDVCDCVAGFCSGFCCCQAAVTDTGGRAVSSTSRFPDQVLEHCFATDNSIAEAGSCFFHINHLSVSVWISTIIVDGFHQGFLIVCFDQCRNSAECGQSDIISSIERFCAGPLSSYVRLYWSRFETEQRCSQSTAQLRHAENSLRVLREQQHDILEENIRQREELEEINEQLIAHKQQLEEYGRSLEEKVNERTRELQRAKERAEESDRFKSTFLANMSHEMRTPLNAILGFVEVVLEEPLSEEQKQYLHKVTRGGQHLLDLLNDILDLSKLEARQMQIELIPASLDHLFSDIQSSATTLVVRDEKNVEVRQRRDRCISSFIMCDPRSLFQIMNNLVSNAAKFTESGYIEYGVRPHDGNMLLFYVADTGIGIPLDKQKLIFESFQQADNSTTRKYGGTGLGLTITKNLVELIGGSIWIESEPGRGSTFYFTIPYAPSEQPEEAKDRSGDASELPVSCTASPGSVSILLVEDNPDNQLLAKTILEKQGYRITVANDGIEAIEAFQKSLNSLTLILMDMQMPKMGGLEATAHIRQLEKANSGPKIPIIALTAGAMEGEREECLKGGCDDYLAKPIKKQKLLSVIQQYAYIK